MFCSFSGFSVSSQESFTNDIIISNLCRFNNNNNKNNNDNDNKALVKNRR